MLLANFLPGFLMSQSSDAKYFHPGWEDLYYNFLPFGKLIPKLIHLFFLFFLSLPRVYFGRAVELLNLK